MITKMFGKVENTGEMSDEVQAVITSGDVVGLLHHLDHQGWTDSIPLDAPQHTHHRINETSAFPPPPHTGAVAGQLIREMFPIQSDRT